MTDAATHSILPSDLRAVVQRRLVGLAVLLVIVFLLSLLLRSRPDAPDALPSVVIPLGGEAATANAVSIADTAPTLDAVQPPPQSADVAVAASPSMPIEKRRLEPSSAATQEAKPSSALVEKPRTEKPPAPKTAKPVKPPPALAAAKPTTTPRWFVVVGAYKDPMAAQAIANRVKLAGLKVEILPVTASGQRFNRVRAGPFSKKADAESARVTLIVEGLTKAVTVGERQ